MLNDVFHFLGEDARKYGANAAVILYNLRFWVMKNKANKRNFHEGRYWTYNTVTAFQELFPFMTGDQIRRALEKLIDEGAILEGNFNATAYDRTKWYTVKEEEVVEIPHLANLPNAFGENAKWNRQNCQMDPAEVPNGFGENAEPIPDIKPDLENQIENTLPILAVLWNDHCPPLSPVKKWTKGREEALKKVSREFPDIEFWKEAIARVSKSKFCIGEKTGWKATFDWMIGKDKAKTWNALKAYEGNYDNQKEALNKRQGDNQAREQEAMKKFGLFQGESVG